MDRILKINFMVKHWSSRNMTINGWMCTTFNNLFYNFWLNLLTLISVLTLLLNIYQVYYEYSNVLGNMKEDKVGLGYKDNKRRLLSGSLHLNNGTILIISRFWNAPISQYTYTYTNTHSHLPFSLPPLSIYFVPLLPRSLVIFRMMMLMLVIMMIMMAVNFILSTSHILIQIILQQSCEMYTFFISILQMKKWKHKEVICPKSNI